MRGGQHASGARGFLYGGTGQIVDKKEKAAMDAINRENKQQEAEAREDHDRVVEKIKEYEKKQLEAEKAFYAMENRIKEWGFPTPFIKKSYSLAEWMELNGVEADVQSFWDEHYERFVDLYARFAQEEEEEAERAEALKREAQEAREARLNRETDEFEEDMTYVLKGEKGY